MGRRNVMYMDVKSQHTEKAMDDHPRKIFLVNEHAENCFFGVILGICVQWDCGVGLSEKQLGVSIESHNKACAHQVF